MASDRMMVTKAKIDRIGGAIREKLGETQQYTLDEMPGKIREIIGSTTVEPLSVTQNGIYTAEEGKAYSPVTVNVQSGGTIGDVVNFTATNAGNIATITWTDPVDTASGMWAATMIVAKYGSVPLSPIDGETVVIERTRNTYSVNGYRYQFVKGEDCFFRAFIFTTAGDIRAGSFASVKATLDIVPWSTGTDEQIVEMIKAADEGIIDLYEDAGWRVGDSRIIHIDAIPSVDFQKRDKTYKPTNAQDAQDIEMVLLQRLTKQRSYGYTLAEPKKPEITTPSFLVGMKDCLATYEFFHCESSKTQTEDWTYWRDSNMRQWCHYFGNALPDSIYPIFKTVNVEYFALDYSERSRHISDDILVGGGTRQDKFFLPSFTEIPPTNMPANNRPVSEVDIEYDLLDYYIPQVGVTPKNIKHQGTGSTGVASYWFRDTRHDYPSDYAGYKNFAYVMEMTGHYGSTYTLSLVSRMQDVNIYVTIQACI